MSAFAGVQGYENLSSAQQQERTAAGLLDNGLARKPSATPARLSRVLHVPPHCNSGFHINLQDVSAEYKHAIGHAPMGGSDIIGDALMGSRLYITRLGTLKKHLMGMQHNNPQYAADANVSTDETVVTLRSYPDGDQSPSVAM